MTQADVHNLFWFFFLTVILSINLPFRHVCSCLYRFFSRHFQASSLEQVARIFCGLPSYAVPDATVEIYFLGLVASVVSLKQLF